MTNLARASLMLAVLVSLPACNKPQSDTIQAADSPGQPLEATPASSPPPTRSLTVSSVFIDPKIASLCGMAQPKAFFEFDSAVVEPAEDRALATLATCATSGPLKDRKLDLVGHTDPRGTDEYNAKLGQSRAQAVERYLAAQGMGASTMNVKSEGEQGPIRTPPPSGRTTAASTSDSLTESRASGAVRLLARAGRISRRDSRHELRSRDRPADADASGAVPRSDGGDRR